MSLSSIMSVRYVVIKWSKSRKKHTHTYKNRIIPKTYLSTAKKKLEELKQTGRYNRVK